MSALASLLTGIVDYAGLFPPASLDFRRVVANYRRYQTSRHRWMLGQLIVPAAKLSELDAMAADEASETTGDSRWEISAILPPLDAPDHAFAAAVEAVKRFGHGPSSAVVGSVEVPVSTAEQIGATVKQLSSDLTCFVEVPHDHSESFINELERQGPGIYGKIRTGGVTSQLIPTPRQVARFICACAQAGIGFKATAGLHHPFRAEYALTYDDDSPRSVMHGFLNVFIAAGFASARNWQADQVEQVLQETNPDAFTCAPSEIRWRDYTLSEEHVGEMRDSFAISFGSCSFEEPVDDLSSRGWLETIAPTA